MSSLKVFIAHCYLAWGRYFNIPLIGVSSGSSIEPVSEPLGNPFNTAATPGTWTDFSFPMSFLERVQNTFLHYTINAQKNYYISDQNRQIEEFFGPGYPSASELPKDLDLLLINSHYSLDGILPLTPAIVPVGGLHIVDDKTKLPDVNTKYNHLFKNYFSIFI